MDGVSRQKGRHFVLAAVLALANLAVIAEQRVYSVDIAAADLASALQSLARQSGVSVFYTDASVAGHRAAGLKGRFALSAALDQLLKDTGLSYRLIDEQTVAIKPTPHPSEPVILPTVTVAEAVEDDISTSDDSTYLLPSLLSGTKTETPVMATPLNVQAVSAQVLKDQQVIYLEQALKNFSGVSSTNALDGLGSFGEQLTVRGFATTTLFRNGFRMSGNAFGNGQQFANVESIEVLKGPAAVLYGRVEPGGMVNVITKQPQTKPFYALSQQLGSYDLYRTTIDATGPLNPDATLLYRTNASFQSNQTLRDLDSHEDWFLAPVLTWNISPQTQFSLDLEYQRQQSNLSKSYLPFTNQQLIELSPSINLAEQNPLHTEHLFVGYKGAHQFNDSWAILHLVSFKRQDWRYQKAAFPVRIDLNNQTVMRDIASAIAIEDSLATSLDLTGHFNTGFLQHALLLGGDYYREYGFVDLTQFSPSRLPYRHLQHPAADLAGITPIFEVSLNNYYDNYGVYLQDQVELPGRIHLLAGMRYQYVHNHFDQSLYDYVSNSQEDIEAGYPADDAITPRFGLLWQAQDWLSIYGNYVENFGASNAGSLSSENSPLPPESAQQWELGIKTQVLDNRLRLTLAYYDLTTQNVRIQDRSAGHDCGGGLGSCTLAAGEINSHGPELDIIGEIQPGWQVIANYANQAVRVSKGNNDAGQMQQGNRLMNVPRNIGSIWTTYEFQQGLLQGLKFGGGLSLRDDTTDFYNNYRSPGYALVSLMSAYRFKAGRSKIQLQLNVENLLNESYVANVLPQGGLTNMALANYSTPRSFMGLISVEF